MSDIQQAVEVRDAAARAPKVDLAVVVRETIERQEQAFRSVLPGETDPKRFTRLVLSSVKATPGLISCFNTKQGQQSLLIAAMQSASVGLEPNTPTQDCWILPRKNKNVVEAQLILGYRGLIKLVRRSGELRGIQAFDVREHDDFDWHYGLDTDYLHYKQGPSGERGELKYSYAIARFTNGGSNFIVLNQEDVERRRAMSPSWAKPDQRKYSPWFNWPEAMWRKSAIRALVPYLELAPEIARVVEADERPLRFDENLGEIVGTDDAYSLEEGSEDDEPVNDDSAATSGTTGDAPAAVEATITAPTVESLIALAQRKGIVTADALGAQRNELTRWMNATYDTKYQHPGQFMQHTKRMSDADELLRLMEDVGQGAS